jgi:putative ABC transport system substrate-binding protein
MSSRREFITLLGGAAAVWPLTARAQQSERVRRIGFLHDYEELDPDGRVQVVAFREALEKLGWTDGRNVIIDYRSAPPTMRSFAVMQQKSWHIIPMLC